MRLQIVRFLEPFRWAFSWIKTEGLFLYIFRIELLYIFSFITCHSRTLQCVEFKNFCSFSLCSVLLFFHNLCPEYSWIPLELSLLRLFSVVCLWLYILTEKVSLSKKRKEFSSILKRTDSSAFGRRVCLFFFWKKTKKVVSCCIKFIFVEQDWIIVISSEEGYRLLSCVCPQRKYYTPYAKIFFQISWAINVKATHNCSPGPV